ncbi:GntR family transcriptional regulator [Streptomyces sp. NPDC050560]|uniref:GntR family transcriptional regulator n=1 Tax=Streptomyces sp. NPDC050560 TaxID=3365630 RepID=UPI0037AE135E
MTVGRLAAAGRARTAHEYALATLRTAILDGTLAGGTRLVQTELAAELNISTTPLREALRDLSVEGLVVMDPHRGAVVRRLDIDEVREIYQLRITLEPLMVRRVAERITPDQLDHAEDLALRMQRESHMSAWVDLNREFHAVFGEPDQGSKLAGILANLRDSASPYVSLSLRARPEQVPEANSEHADLVRLYRAGEIDAVEELTLQHLRSTLSAIEAAHERGVL